MINEGLEIEEVSIKNIVRLGKKEEDRTRLLKVTLESVKNKREILMKAKKLREAERWERVFVTPDLTPKERQQNKELREELKQRTKDGEEGLVIRRGKIVKLQTSQEGQGRHSESSQPFRA